MTFLASLGYAVQGACAFVYGHFSDWWTRSGRSEASVSPLDDGRQPDARRGQHPRRWLTRIARVEIGILLCLAGAASASLSMNLYAVAQMFAGPRASGTWVGVQNCFRQSVGNLRSDRHRDHRRPRRLRNAFILTAAVAAFGALWWASVPFRPSGRSQLDEKLTTFRHISRAAPLLLLPAAPVEPVSDAREPFGAPDCERGPGQQVEPGPRQERRAPGIGPQLNSKRRSIGRRPRMETASVGNDERVRRHCEMGRLRKTEPG